MTRHINFDRDGEPATLKMISREDISKLSADDARMVLRYYRNAPWADICWTATEDYKKILQDIESIRDVLYRHIDKVDTPLKPSEIAFMLSAGDWLDLGGVWGDDPRLKISPVRIRIEYGGGFAPPFLSKICFYPRPPSQNA